NQLPCRQLARSPELGIRVVGRYFEALEIGLCPDEVRARLFDLRLNRGGVEPGDDLAFLDERVEVRVEVLNDSRDLRADLDGRNGLQCTGGTHSICDITAGDGGGC